MSDLCKFRAHVDLHAQLRGSYVFNWRNSGVTLWRKLYSGTGRIRRVVSTPKCKLHRGNATASASGCSSAVEILRQGPERQLSRLRLSQCLSNCVMIVSLTLSSEKQTVKLNELKVKKKMACLERSGVPVDRGRLVIFYNEINARPCLRLCAQYFESEFHFFFFFFNVANRLKNAIICGRLQRNCKRSCFCVDNRVVGCPDLYIMSNEEVLDV